jgi:hypothetical protein
VDFLLLSKVNKQARRPPISIDLSGNVKDVSRNEAAIEAFIRSNGITPSNGLRAADPRNCRRRRSGCAPALRRAAQLRSRGQQIIASDRSFWTSRALAGSGE